MADALVTRAKSRLTSTHLLLSVLSFRPVNEQPGDQRRLRQQSRHGADNVDLVAIPGRGLPEEDLRSCGKTSVGNAPTLHLTPIDDWHHLCGFNRECPEAASR